MRVFVPTKYSSRGNFILKKQKGSLPDDSIVIANSPDAELNFGSNSGQGSQKEQKSSSEDDFLFLILLLAVVGIVFFIIKKRKKK